MINDTIKTWRIFLFGICCIFLSLYVKEALIYFQIIEGVFLSKSIVYFSVVWFVAGVFRIYHLNRRTSESQTAFIKDKWCLTEYISAVILAVGLTMIR